MTQNNVGIQNDASLIQRVLSGDSGAMTQLVERHSKSLIYFLRNRVGNEAEDLSQEVWTKVSRGLVKYESQGTFKGWLFQIARRTVIDHRRKKNSKLEVVNLQVDVSRNDHPETQVIASQLSLAVSRQIDLLAPEVAEVLRMRISDGLPFREVAKRQGVPLNTALSRMHRGLSQLRATLIESGHINENPKGQQL